MPPTLGAVERRRHPFTPPFLAFQAQSQRQSPMTASLEGKTHVFIVRLWCEPREIDGAPLEWRGVIEHVPTGRRHFFRDLDDILAFIDPHLHAVGRTFTLCWRIRQWFKRRWK